MNNVRRATRNPVLLGAQITAAKFPIHDGDELPPYEVDAAGFVLVGGERVLTVSGKVLRAETEADRACLCQRCHKEGAASYTSTLRRRWEPRAPGGARWGYWFGYTPGSSLWTLCPACVAKNAADAKAAA